MSTDPKDLAAQLAACREALEKIQWDAELGFAEDLGCGECEGHNYGKGARHSLTCSIGRVLADTAQAARDYEARVTEPLKKRIAELESDPRLAVPLDGPGSHAADLAALRECQARAETAERERDQARYEMKCLRYYADHEGGSCSMVAGLLVKTEKERDAALAQVAALRAALEELADLTDAHMRGEYDPDSFTTQPARLALTDTARAAAEHDEQVRREALEEAEGKIGNRFDKSKHSITTIAFVYDALRALAAEPKKESAAELRSRLGFGPLTEEQQRANLEEALRHLESIPSCRLTETVRRHRDELYEQRRVSEIKIADLERQLADKGK